MRKELLEDIDRIIKQAALDGALTEDAIGYYNGLIKVAEEKKAENEVLQRELKECDEQRRAEANKHHEAVQKLNAANQRLADIDEREKKCMEIEVRHECAERRVSDHIEMVRLIFRNPVTHSQFVTPGHPGNVDQYGNVQNQSWPEKHDIETEEK